MSVGSVRRQAILEFLQQADLPGFRLNLIEPWFPVLVRAVLHHTNLNAIDEIGEHLLSAITYLNAYPKP